MATEVLADRLTDAAAVLRHCRLVARAQGHDDVADAVGELLGAVRILAQAVAERDRPTVSDAARAAELDAHA